MNFRSNPVDEEDEQAKILEEKALRLQRKQRIEHIVRMRLENIGYLQQVHEGGKFWLNCVYLDETDIRRYVSNFIPLQVLKQRTLSYFYFALSLSKILDLDYQGTEFLQATSQLLEEWEYFFSGITMQSVKFVMAKSSFCLYPGLSNSQQRQISNLPNPSSSIATSETPLTLEKPCLYKFNNSIVFDRLYPFNLPFELDYVECLYSFCGVLLDVYQKFLHEQCYSSLVGYDCVVKFDKCIKTILLSLLTKELSEFSLTCMKVELEAMRAGDIHPTE